MARVCPGLVAHGVISSVLWGDGDEGPKEKQDQGEEHAFLLSMNMKLHGIRTEEGERAKERRVAMVTKKCCVACSPYP